MTLLVYYGIFGYIPNDSFPGTRYPITAKNMATQPSLFYGTGISIGIGILPLDKRFKV